MGLSWALHCSLVRQKSHTGAYFITKETEPQRDDVAWTERGSVLHLPLLNPRHFGLCASPLLVNPEKTFNKQESYFCIQGLNYSLEGGQLLGFQTNLKSYEYL